MRIDRIADRENATRTSIILKALEEYDEWHGKGNSQTTMESHFPGGIRSDGQIQQEIILEFEAKPEWMDINFKAIILRLKEVGYSKEKLSQSADRVAKTLNEKGRKVWR